MFDIWIKAITGPNEDNYLSILKSNEPSVGTAALWMVIAGVISGLAAGGLGLVLGSPFEEFGVGAGVLFIYYPISIVISFFLGAGLYYVVSKALGGTGSFGEQSYLMAAGLAPLNIAAAAIGAIPIVGGCITAFISLYLIFLNILSIKTAHRFDWGKAVAAVLIPVIILFVLACGCIIVLTLTGAAVGGVFEEITRELEGMQ